MRARSRSAVEDELDIRVRPLRCSEVAAFPCRVDSLRTISTFSCDIAYSSRPRSASASVAVEVDDEPCHLAVTDVEQACSRGALLDVDAAYLAAAAGCAPARGHARRPARDTPPPRTRKSCHASNHGRATPRRHGAAACPAPRVGSIDDDEFDLGVRPTRPNRGTRRVPSAAKIERTRSRFSDIAYSASPTALRASSRCCSSRGERPSRLAVCTPGRLRGRSVSPLPSPVAVMRPNTTTDIACVDELLDIDAPLSQARPQSLKPAGDALVPPIDRS